MLTGRRISLVLGAALLAGLLASSGALATPITVNLRVEGSARTLFEGPVSVEPITASPGIETEPSEGGHPCDLKDNGQYPPEGAAAATPTAALYEAAVANKLAFNASWSNEYNDFLVSQVGTDIEGGAPAYEAWGFAVNYTTAPVGGCQFRLAPGSEVLWAYNYFNLKHLLTLSGPSSVEVGVPFKVKVTDGQTGEPIPSASIGEDVEGVTGKLSSSTATDASGEATVTLNQVGTVKLKATQAESVRSNELTVSVDPVPCGCVGEAGPPLESPQPELVDVAKIEHIGNGYVYPRGKAPRLLAGVITVPAGGTLRQVQISLKRRHHKRCSRFSGRRGRFVRMKCHHAAGFFSVGGAESFRYLLPRRLPRGRYVYDIKAIDGTGKATKLVNGESHVVFRVK
jgi:hypothetical protein